MTPADPRRPFAGWTPRVQGVALGLLLLAEFLLFQRLNAESAWIYPRWDDQVQYLTEAYRGYEYRLDHGFWAGIWQTWVHLSAQGTLHDFFALIGEGAAVVESVRAGEVQDGGGRLRERWLRGGVSGGGDKAEQQGRGY